MTEQLLSEEYKQQLSSVSHEIRNHLSICDMYAQILKKNFEKLDIDNPSVNNAIDCIQQSIRIMSSDLLELKSMQEPNLRVYDFEKLVIKAFEMSKAYVEDKNINFEITIKNTANILTDENRLISCIVNIIKNAIEAIEVKGNISLIGAVNGERAVIKISNDGKMIPKEKQGMIFNSGYTSKKTGNGLGLCICKKYLESQNAAIRLVQSAKSRTVFEIDLPVAQ